MRSCLWLLNQGYDTFRIAILSNEDSFNEGNCEKAKHFFMLDFPSFYKTVAGQSLQPPLRAK